MCQEKCIFHYFLQKNSEKYRHKSYKAVSHTQAVSYSKEQDVWQKVISALGSKDQ